MFDKGSYCKILFPFFKIFDITVAVLQYTFFYCHKLPTFICNSLLMQWATAGIWMGNLQSMRGKNSSPSIFFDQSLMMDDLGVVSDTSRPGQVLPPVTGCILLLQPVSIPVPECLWMWQRQPPLSFCDAGFCNTITKS